MSLTTITNQMKNLNLSPIVLNKLYTITIKNYSFGNLPINEINSLYKDGRVFSHFFEKYLPTLHQLTWQSGCRSWDLIDSDGKKYEQKTFTKKCNFKRSKSIGIGRTHNQEEFENYVKDIIYIIVDNQEFPKIQYKFVTGTELIKAYPNGNIPASDKENFFCNFSDEIIEIAIQKYATFHNIELLEVSIFDILKSSAGIEGWANSN